MGPQTWPSGGSHKMAISGYQQVFFQQLPLQLLFFMTDLSFHWIFTKLKGQSHWEPEQCVPSLTPPSSAPTPVRVHRRHSGTLTNTALPHSLQAPLSPQWVLRTPSDTPQGLSADECLLLRGAHSQDALGVLPKGSASLEVIPSLEKAHITSSDLGYKGPLSSIWGISEGPAQLQSGPRGSAEASVGAELS